MNKIVENFKDFPPFGKDQGLPKDEIIDLLEFYLLHKR